MSTAQVGDARMSVSWCAIVEDVRTWLLKNPDFYLPVFDWATTAIPTATPCSTQAAGRPAG
jgi:hypothetical protein